MIVTPTTRLIYANMNEDDTAVCIGDVRGTEYVEVPIDDIPSLIRRLKELRRAARAGLEEDID